LRDDVENCQLGIVTMWEDSVSGSGPLLPHTRTLKAADIGGNRGLIHPCRPPYERDSRRGLSIASV
jgi:hypothetical protein